MFHCVQNITFDFFVNYNIVVQGASSDSQQATALARAMVTNYCMSDKVSRPLGSSRSLVFFLMVTFCFKQLGMVQVKDTEQLSPETQALIESEVKKLLTVKFVYLLSVI